MLSENINNLSSWRFWLVHLQVLIILFVCQYIVSLMWQWHIDPDNAAIPYLTALGDLLGTLLLFIVFLILDRYDTKDIVSIKHWARRKGSIFQVFRFLIF